MSIKSEEISCRAAFEGVEVGAIVQHPHHERWLEILTQPAKNRIDFILSHKRALEQPDRLRYFRPLLGADLKKAYADWKKAYADLEKAHADLKKAVVEEGGRGLGEGGREAYADWKKADADWKKADADREKAEKSPAMIALHAEVCGCPWDATHDIFGQEKERS